MKLYSSTWAEINLENIKQNVNNVKNALSKNTKLCCVIKANAYGHGAVEISKFLDSDPNVDFFSVARLEEALPLTRANIQTPILCMGYIDEDKLQYAIDHNIRITVYSLDYANKINDLAKSSNKKAIIHIKVDTGMSRIGFLVNNTSIKEIKKIFDLKHIVVEGIYTHFAKSDIQDKGATYVQIEKFNHVLRELKDSCLEIPIKHTSNSAAILDQRDCDFNMVRLGISLYGSYPSDEVSRDITLQTALELKTKVSNIKWIEPGTAVSYAGTYVATKPMKLATIPVGYADGFPRTQKNPQVYVNGKLLNIVGRICMDQTMFAVPDDVVINIGDEVLLIGDIDGIRIGDISKKISTIDHEILCCLTSRVDRVYISGEHQYTINNIYSRCE